MHNRTYEWKDLTDSRELLEARTSPIISGFLVILVILLAVALGWSYYGEMDIVVKAQAVVRPNEQISTVSSSVQGRITELNYKSGQHVHQGDVLLRMEQRSMTVQQAALQAEYTKAREDQGVLERMESLVEKAMNGDASASEQLSAMKTGSNANRLKWQVAFEQVQLKLRQAEADFALDSKLMKSLKEGRNLFAPEELYYQKVENYQLKKADLLAALDQATDAYKSAYSLGGDIQQQEDGVASAQRNLTSYTNQYMLDLHSTILDEQKQLEQLRLDRQNLLVQLREDTEAQKKQTTDLNNQLQDLDLQISEHTIKAPIDGIVNTGEQYAVGDLLQPGTRLLTIVPEQGSEFVMQVAINNADIGDIKPGTVVKYNFAALPAKEYGHLTGKMLWIGADATSDSDSGQSYYLGESTLNGKALTAKDGQKQEVKVGMTAEAQIITRHEKILTWLLKKMDFID